MNSICFLTAARWIVLRTTVFVLFEKLLMSETVWAVECEDWISDVACLICVFFLWYWKSNSLFSPLFWRWNKIFHHCSAESLLELNVLVWSFGSHLTLHRSHISLRGRRCGSWTMFFLMDSFDCPMLWCYFFDLLCAVGGWLKLESVVFWPSWSSCFEDKTRFFIAS